MIRSGLNFPPTALHSPQLPLRPAPKAHSSQKPDMHSVHANAMFTGVAPSQVAQTSLRGVERAANSEGVVLEGGVAEAEGGAMVGV